jgi:hypothetical protein
MSAKLAKLEALVADLEKAAGINPDFEVVRQRADGSCPAPQTTAALIVERVNFRNPNVPIAQGPFTRVENDKYMPNGVPRVYPQ